MKFNKEIFFLIMVLFCWASPSFAEPNFFLAEIRGSINPASASFFEDSLKKAQAAKSEVFILELDTPGGLLTSVRKMVQAIDSTTVPVVVYTTPAGASATSAGALLMLGSHVAAMAPGTNIGAAHPVGPDGKEVEGAMGEKVVNDTAAFARGLAELRGRSIEVAEKIVSKSKSFTADEAKKNKFIEIIANDRSDLLQKLDGYTVKLAGKEHQLKTKGLTQRSSEMSPGQKFLNILAHPNVTAILMTLGMLLIYVELTNPGITIAGIGGAICLVIAFMAFQLIPIHTGGMALLILGMVLMIAEPLVGAGGALAGGGLISFVLGMLWFVDPAESQLKISFNVWIPLAVGLGGSIALLAFAASRTKILSNRTFAMIGGRSMGGLSGYEGHVTALDPEGLHGKANFRGEIWDFESDEVLSLGDPIVVRKKIGFKLMVNKAKKES